MARILFCTDTYPPQLNGVSVVTAAMVAGLQARGWECAVLAPSYPLAGRRVLWSPDVAQRFSVPSATLPSYPEVRLAWPTTRRVREAFDSFQPDLVHCATEFTVGWMGMHEATRRGVPVCTTSHTDFSKYCSAYGMPFLRPIVRRWLRQFHAQASRTLVPSRSAQQDLRLIGVPRAHVWSGGVDAELFHPRHFSLPLRQRLAVGRAFTFLHVGRLAPEKNVDLVLAAFALLRVMLPDAPLRLLVAGAGPAERHLRSLATPGVTFLGAVDRTSELPALYASVDAFMTASVTETLGLVGLEAMASGLPVIACLEGGMRDYLEHANNGLAFKAGDVNEGTQMMARLVTDPSLLERLRLGARRTAEGWSSQREFDRLDEMLRGEIRARATTLAPGFELSPHAAR